MSIYTYYLFIYFFIFCACSRLAFTHAPVPSCLGGWAYRCITLIFMGERLYFYVLSFFVWAAPLLIDRQCFDRFYY